MKLTLSILLLSLSLLTACVTETRVAGSNKPVVENQTQPDDAARNRVALGLRYLQNGNTAQAKYNLERAREYAPYLGEVHYALAYYYQRVSEPELAEAAYKDALQYGPHDGSTMNNYGVFLCQNNRIDEAVGMFLAAVKEPSYIRVADAYENAGLCLLSNTDVAQAKKYFSKALSYNAARPRSLMGMADANLQLKELESADFYFKQYLKNNSIDVDSAVVGYKLAVAKHDIDEQKRYELLLKSRYPNAYEALLAEHESAAHKVKHDEG
ncbi:type IV pilus biogenesis/stability protein PilW [Echinimonas agarilytica]|uniref:Type IV pilus biogenesis/stability protein PilW n=1 Tax=Echinimonas agarilytica TaxID=1215918 RepID=A0AA42B7V8_9GAMM|nr:type IV pilus biogenesis/stability protein PilW [Echinimonas agarilytica]MCM2680139.1 type IV pilus biogenesis/stability protein PilW [Echinimonas agarilytica]